MPDIDFVAHDPRILTIQDFVSCVAPEWENFAEPIANEVFEKFGIKRVFEIKNVKQFEKVFGGITGGIMPEQLFEQLRTAYLKDFHR